ncbi:MAG: hypothetical protein KDI48_10310 [Xanthomonadales bacterium]|nr:hypothetical protein [Xanthomonadales bacterium]
MKLTANRCLRGLLALSLPWFALLSSGYDLGQLVFGLRVLFSAVPAGDDTQRTLAFAGTAVLTALPMQLGAGLCLVGSAALLANRRWSIWPLLAGSLILCWPLLVWIVIFAVWRVLDGLGSALLLMQILITLALIIALPILGWFATRLRLLPRAG